MAELILSQFRDLGVKVIAADSGTELTAGDDDPTRTLIRQVLGAVAQFEKAVIVRTGCPWAGETVRGIVQRA